MLINIKNLNKTYKTQGGVTHRALNNINLTFDDKGLVYIVGKSGSGKSTLLHLIGGLDKFDSGAITIAGHNLNEMTDHELDSYRNTIIGFVFQEHNLLNCMKTDENVALAVDLQKKDNSKQQAHNQLDDLGLQDKYATPPSNLSGGQRQRVAIARALVKKPEIILADEPTGALDSNTSDDVMKIFKEISIDRLVIVVTHDLDMALKYGDRIIQLHDGTVYRDIMKKPTDYKDEEDNIHFYSDTLIHIDKNCSFTDDDTEKLNEILSQRPRKAYINFETDKNKLKALFPQLREAINYDKNAKNPAPNSENNNESNDNISLTPTQDKTQDFIPYKHSDTSMAQCPLTKSYFPMRKAIKIGLYNIKSKIFSMILAILLITISLTLFGFSGYISYFDSMTAYNKTIDAGVDDFNIVTANGSNFRTNLFDSTVGKNINNYGAIYKIKMEALDLYNTDYMSTYNSYHQLNGFIEIDDVTKIGLSLLHGTQPTDINEVVISSEFANSFVEANIVNQISLLIGKEINIANHIYKVSGIFDSKLNTKNMDSFDTMEYLDYKKSQRDGFIYGQKGITEQFLKTNPLNVCTTINNAWNLTFSLSYFNQASKLYPDLTKDKTLNSKEILISSSLYNNIYNNTPIENIIDTPIKLLLCSPDDNSQNNTQPLYFLDNYIIKGVYDSEIYSQIHMIVSDNDINDIICNFIPCSGIKISKDNISSSTEQMTKALYSSGYAIDGDFTSYYSNFSQSFATISPITKFISMILFILSAILLFNYLYNSIKLTRKQVGTLRALGLSRGEVFKIYLMEGLALTIISCALSLILLTSLPPIINHALSVKAGFSTFIFNINIVTILLIPVMSVIITIASTLLALRKLNKISPIEAITGKN